MWIPCRSYISFLCFMLQLEIFKVEFSIGSASLKSSSLGKHGYCSKFRLKAAAAAVLGGDRYTGCHGLHVLNADTWRACGSAADRDYFPDQWILNQPQHGLFLGCHRQSHLHRRAQSAVRFHVRNRFQSVLGLRLSGEAGCSLPRWDFPLLGESQCAIVQLFAIEQLHELQLESWRRWLVLATTWSELPPEMDMACSPRCLIVGYNLHGSREKGSELCVEVAEIQSCSSHSS